MGKFEKKALYVLLNVLPLILVFIATTIPDMIFNASYFADNIAGYEWIRYALNCIGWMLFWVFAAVQFIRVLRYMFND